MLEFPKNIEKAVTMLEDAGYEAYVVGGCVRDYLLGRRVNDYDIATSAEPTHTKAVFAEYQVIEIGIKHGTVAVLIDDEPIEITTFRLESDYSDGRHPDSVQFTSDLYADLSRRDFTMNAIAYNRRVGLIDPFGGEEDIARGVIRCVGDPDERFAEDALRILRAARFSSILGFRLDERTEAAAVKHLKLLERVSSERIAEEFKKLICGNYVKTALIACRSIIIAVLPELSGNGEIYRRLAEAVSDTEKRSDLRFAALFSEASKLCGEGGDATTDAEMCNSALKRLRLDNRTRNSAVKLTAEHGRVIEYTTAGIKNALYELGADTYFDLISLKRTLGMERDEYEYLRCGAEHIIVSNECFSLKTLAVSGADITATGLYRGREIGAELDLLLRLVIDGQLENQKETLLTYAIENAKL